jgi:hypothetical protein
VKGQFEGGGIYNEGFVAINTTAADYKTGNLTNMTVKSIATRELARQLNEQRLLKSPLERGGAEERVVAGGAALIIL